MTRKTAYRAQIEMLERRETPSASASALARQVVPITGTGTAQTSGLITLPAPGSFITATNIQGTIDGFSTFTGQGGVNVTLHRDAIGNVDLTLADGNQLTVRIKGKLHFRPNLDRPATAAGTFRVLGGTGPLDGATGRGHLRGEIDQVTGLATFTFRGRLVF